MKHYELLYLIPGTFTEDEVPAIRTMVNALIAKYEGTITFEKSLGKKKLAYPVKKYRQGYYILNEIDIEPSEIIKLDNDLRLASEILRHTIVIKKIISAEEKEKSKKLSAKINAEMNKPEAVAPVTPAVKPSDLSNEASVKVEETETPAPAVEPVTPKASEKTEDVSTEASAKTDDSKVKLEDLDKKLDEILEGDIM